MLDGFAPDAVREIRRRLDSVRKQGIRIGFAVESGSRAWGFPSPDSDYDCRFVYIRPVVDHLRLGPVRDVIEFPIVGLIDTGGWDLRKALQLALAGNAVIVEWLKSPLIYEEEPGFRGRMTSLLDDVMDPRSVARHYIGLLQKHGGDRLETARLKKFLYALRPAIALNWMAANEYRSLPPMRMQDCMEGAGLSDAVYQETLSMIETKMRTREMGEGLPHPILQAFVAETLAQFAGPSQREWRTEPDEEARKAKVEAFYRGEVLGQAPQ